MATKPIIYMDSCCFIDAVKEEVGLLPQNRVSDVWFIRKLLQAHQAGDVVVFTSAADWEAKEGPAREAVNRFSARLST